MACGLSANRETSRPLPIEPPRARSPLPEVVYSPESALSRPAALARGMWRDLLASRALAWRLFVRDTKAQYRQSALGYAWLLLPPVASMLMFAFLQSQNILNVGPTDIPYPAFVLLGTLLWETLAASISAPLTTVSNASSMLTKLNFPRESLLLSALYQVLFSLAIRLTLLVPVFVYFQLPLGLPTLLAPLGIAALVVFGFALGLLLVPLGMLYQDVGRGLAMVTSAWFLVTPIIYPPPTAWPGTLLNRLNPASPLIITARGLLSGNVPADWPWAAGIAAVSAGVLLAAWIGFRVAMPHMIARMSA